MTAADVGLLSTTISNMALDNSLVKFRLISQTINEATGLVPKKVVPSLQRLSVSYSSVSATIRKGLSLTSATAFKFIVKSCKALERGLTPYDLKVLQELGRQLNQGYITELDQFIDTARQDLVAIYTALLPEAAGVHVKSLLEKRDKKEKELIELSQRLKLSAEESGALQGKIDATDYEIEICEQAAGDSVAAKQRMEIELQTLKDKIPHYEDQVQVHRDYHTEERGSFWIFSWKVRDVHVNNGESIARENVAALRQRIQLLEQQIKNWSVEALQKRKAVAISELPKLKESRDAQAQQREILQKDRDRLEREFQEIIKKIQSHYTEAGTSSVEAMLMQQVFPGEHGNFQKLQNNCAESRITTG
ncbi:hypothetical protein BV898_15873 [Hypsibius exemplaris]|nr:hypothetical protein BV898_15873 [Hypsibius exemplaris]